MLTKGSKAPEFTLPNQQGELVSLADFQQQRVVLYFYPKDDTPGCTAQACSYRDNKEAFDQRNVAVLGVSVDDESSHVKFQSKHNLNFTLLSDTNKEVVQAYGVWVEKSMYGKKYMGTARTTFIINNGIIEEVFEKVDPKNDVDLVLAYLDKQ